MVMRVPKYEDEEDGCAERRGLSFLGLKIYSTLQVKEKLITADNLRTGCEFWKKI